MSTACPCDFTWSRGHFEVCTSRNGFPNCFETEERKSTIDFAVAVSMHRDHFLGAHQSQFAPMTSFPARGPPPPRLPAWRRRTRALWRAGGEFLERGNGVIVGGWRVETTTTPILGKAELDALGTRLGTAHLPEMVYGSTLELVHLTGAARGCTSTPKTRSASGSRRTSHRSRSRPPRPGPRDSARGSGTQRRGPPRLPSRAPGVVARHRDPSGVVGLSHLPRLRRSSRTAVPGRSSRRTRAPVAPRRGPHGRVSMGDAPWNATPSSSSTR